MEREYERAAVVASLRAAGALDAAPYMRHALAGGRRENAQLEALADKSLGGRRWALDLGRGKRVRMGWGGNPVACPAAPTPAAAPAATELVKTEVLDLLGVRRAEARLSQELARLRSTGATAEALHRAERVKKKLDFLWAVERAGSADEQANTLTNRVEYRKRTPVGRYQPTWPSLTHCPSTLRGELCTRHTDVDMKNCHPSLLVQIARRAGVEVPRLAEYVKNRARTLQRVSDHYGGVSKGAVKELFLRIINGGGLRRWVDKVELAEPSAGVRAAVSARGHCPFVVEFREEVGCLREVVIGLQPRADDILASVQAATPGEAKDRWSLFSWCLTEVESDCLLAAADYFERVRKIPVDTLVFDGAIVRADALSEADLRRCEAHVRAKTSWSVTLVCKPFPAPD